MDNGKENKQLDELFKSKLEGYESPAGDALWERLNRQRFSKVKPAWYVSKALVAAVVAGVALAGGIWLGVPAGREKLSASMPGERADLPREIANAAVPSADTEVALPAHDTASGAASHTIPDGTKEMPAVVAATAGERTSAGKDSKELPGKPASPVEESSRETVQVAAGAVLPVTKEVKEEEQAGTRVLVIYVRPPAHEEVVPEKPGNELVTVTKVHESEPAEGRKKLSFKRFFKQLKNAKTGEKIDWEELGLNPQRVFANVDHAAGGQVSGSGGQ